MLSVEWPDTSQLFDKAEYVMKNPVDQGGFFSHTFVCHSTMQRHFVHNMHHKKLIYNGQEKKPLKTSVIHCCQTNTHCIFFILTGKKGGRLWEAAALYGKKQKLNHVMIVKTDTP